MVITIDGPSGAGKSTASKRLAKAMGFAYLDTGALYRAVALAAELGGMAEPKDEPAIPAWLPGLDIQARPSGGDFEVLLDGRPVEAFIRNERIGNIASRLSALPAVRELLLDLQRQAGDAGDLVAEGRTWAPWSSPLRWQSFFSPLRTGRGRCAVFWNSSPKTPS